MQLWIKLKRAKICSIFNSEKNNVEAPLEKKNFPKT